MRFPISWLREYVDIPADKTAADIAEILTRVGFEEEEIVHFGAELQGPLVVGRVLEFMEEPQANGKTIRWCQVEVAPGEVTGVVCGARNFFVDDKVVVVRPGAVLPGGFAISARKTYGHVSDGMICSGRELQFSDDHDGIIRLAELGLDPEVGSDAIELLGLRDEVLDVSVLPDRGYAMSMRGIARELAGATGWGWRDPANRSAAVQPAAAAVAGEIADDTAAERLVLRTVADFDPGAHSPVWMQRRLHLSGMRSISLAVDVTNYVMLELGQPLHAFDADKLQGGIRVRRAGTDTGLRTLDEVDRTLDPRDVVIADDSGPVALAGTMGGASTEIGPESRRIVIEAARFSASDVARTSRQHKLSSEASRRFERGVDPALAPVASARAVELLVAHGGAREVGGIDVDRRHPQPVIKMNVDFPARYVGADYSATETKQALELVGCAVEGHQEIAVTPPSWRPDLRLPADLAEEVARIVGYDRIPAVVPQAGVGAGLTQWQSDRRQLSAGMAGAGLVEVLSYPFMGEAELDELLIPAGDPRRRAVRLANPISATQALMRTSVLVPLIATFRRNLGRGHTNVAVFETGAVYLPAEVQSGLSRPGVDRRPSDAEIDQIKTSVPEQPWYVAGVMTGAVEHGQVMGVDHDWDWQQAVATGLRTGAAFSLKLEPLPAEEAPWHPGRCAALVLGTRVVGFAGELHPRVIETLGLPPRTVAFEVNLSALAESRGPAVTARPVATYPKALLDLALVVDAGRSAAEIGRVLRTAGGDVVESVSLFDVYTGAQVPAGKKSLAFNITFRAPDRTLNDVELTQLRADLVSAAERAGAHLR